MNDPFSPSPNGWNAGFGQDDFPGIEGSFSGPPAVIESSAVTAQPVAVTATKSALPFNISNLGDLKNLVDRMGGIEGVLSTMGKVQKFMSTMQQMAPMIKLFMGNKGKAAATATGSKTSSSRRRQSRRTSGRKSASVKRVSKKR